MPRSVPAEEWEEAYLETNVNRVLRGGSWYNPEKAVRGAYRDHHYASRDRNYYNGVRVASHSSSDEWRVASGE